MGASVRGGGCASAGRGKHCVLTHAAGGSGKRKEKVSGWRGPGGHAGALAALLKMAGVVTGL